ncbi:unnamed protein product [Lactuca saligna]|uniref:Protein kinase domain-containing protein n=1 Tax=Lactuca saligna TaxID=75948 RepID=A0AA36EEP4_LACSI|nr:unnamed protein product [Lactuca saligna]
MSTEAAEGDKLLLLPSAQPCRHFSLAEIQSATKDFDDKLIIGQGGFGKVYKGRIYIEETSKTVAIKRLNSLSNQGAIEFRAEIHMLSNLRHCHLVSLIGYCDDSWEMILIYDYMGRGTLYDHLHKTESSLNWEQRLKIAIGAGRGLDYLHTGVGTQHGVIHRDVKSSNILLDDKWAAMISDFGLSKIGPTNQSFSFVDASVKGTFGYLDPEYFYTRKLTRKTDVYAFGVVLFELLSGRLAVDERKGEQHCSLVRWAKKCVKDRKLNQMVDSKIRGTIFPKCLRGFAQIAYRCLCSVLKNRPTMAEIVGSLQAILEIQKRHDNPVEPSGITGFTLKIHKYIVSATRKNDDQISTNSSKTIENQRSSTNKNDNCQSEMPSQHGESLVKDLKCFTYHELILATNFLDYGKDLKVYKCWMDETTCSFSQDKTGLPVAIKRIDFYKPAWPPNFKEFSHPNLEKLIGYCLSSQSDKQGFLVYEFRLNENFHELLYHGAAARLSLAKKVKIAVGIARGIVFLHKTQDERMIGRSSLNRRNILLDEDLTAKLSGYDFTKLEHGYYPRSIQPSKHLESCDYAPWVEVSQLQCNLSGFTVVFAEVLTGKQISNDDEFQMIDNIFIQHGKKSLVHIAESCFQICNEVNS